MSYSWLLFALLSAIFAALVAIFGRVGLKNIDTNTATALRAVVMAIFLVGFIAIQGKLHDIQNIFSSHKALGFIALSGIAGALSWLFYFWALRSGKAGQVASIDRLSIVFVIIFALIFLGEKINYKMGLGACLMALGAILIALA